MRRLATLIAFLVGALALSMQPAVAQTEISVTGAGAGIFPPGATFKGVSLSGLTLGFGVILSTTGVSGDLQVTLVGTVLGQSRNISIESKLSGGLVVGTGAVTVSGTATVDMGDGSLPLTGVPLAVTVSTNAQGQRILTFTVGTTTLPAATITEGSMSFR